MMDRCFAKGSLAASLKSAQSEDFISQILPRAKNGGGKAEFNAAGGGGTSVLAASCTTLPA
jgi:hypothetical protein